MSTARASSVFLLSYGNTIFNQSAHNSVVPYLLLVVLLRKIWHRCLSRRSRRKLQLIYENVSSTFYQQRTVDITDMNANEIQIPMISITKLSHWWKETKIHTILLNILSVKYLIRHFSRAAMIHRCTGEPRYIFVTIPILIFQWDIAVSQNNKMFVIKNKKNYFTNIQKLLF